MIILRHPNTTAQLKFSLKVLSRYFQGTFQGADFNHLNFLHALGIV
jgi:hypothetical protein